LVTAPQHDIEAAFRLPQFPPTSKTTTGTPVTPNWPDLAVGLFDRLTGRNAEIIYEFVDMHVKIPSGTGPTAEHAEWVLSGTMKIRTKALGQVPN
jgi:hypothetical protein